MITHLLIVAVGGFAKVVLHLFPPLPDPGPILGGVNGAVGTVFSYAAGFGAWVPWGAVAAALGVVVAMLAASAVIKLVRIVASFLTLGGGSAA